MKKSAGILVFKRLQDQFEFLLAHPGGPFYKHKDEGAWSIVKGEIDGEEELLETAKREFAEETGIELSGSFIELGSIKQKGGKVVFAWGIEFEIDLSQGFKSNEVEIMWPPKSGQIITIPEIDKLEYFALEVAEIKINVAQQEFLQRLISIVS